MANKGGEQASRPIPIPRRQRGEEAEPLTTSSPIQETSSGSHAIEEESDECCSTPIQETASAESRATKEELGACLSTPIPETAGVSRNLSLLPRTVPHFVSREAECEEVVRYLCPTHDCRCVLLHGAPGIGKTALAIKVANEILDDRTVVVYLNCRFIDSFEDFAGKVLQQIYHYPLNDPVSGMAKRLNNSDFYTILLLDNFEFLLHLNNERENPLLAENVYGRINREPSEGMKVEDFIAEMVTTSRKVKLLVTSSEDVAFPGIGKQRIKLAPFNEEASFQLLTKVCEGRPVRKACADQLTDICSGIPLVLYTLMSSQDDLVSCVQQMSCSPPGEKFVYLQKIQTVPKSEKITVCLDVCFDRLSDKEKDTLIRLALLRGWFTPTGAAKVFNSAALREDQLIGHVIELANRSLLERNIIGGDCFYTFLSVIRDYCKRKASTAGFCEVFHNARDLFMGHFVAFLKDTFKAFLSKNAARAIADFLREEENIMQLLEWMDNGEMDDKRMKTCIDVFNMVGELLAKMMGKAKFKSVYELLRKKCQDMGDQKRLSECLTSLGIKEVFNCSCSPGLCDGASERAKTYFVEADGHQTALDINSGNSRAQCLAKLGRCLAKEHDSRERGKAKIKEAIRIRLNAHGDENGGEDICKVMLGATYNDMAVALSLEENHRQAVKIREEQTLPIYRGTLGDHPFTATILNNLSNNYCALGEFDNAKRYSEDALEIRLELLKNHMDTAKSLFDLAMVHKEMVELEIAKPYLERCKAMQEKVLDDTMNIEDLARTKQELQDVCNRLNNMQLK